MKFVVATSSTGFPDFAYGSVVEIFHDSTGLRINGEKRTDFKSTKIGEWTIMFYFEGAMLQVRSLDYWKNPDFSETLCVGAKI